MAAVISYLFGLAIAAGSYVAITRVYKTYHSVPLMLFLGLFIALPLIGAAFKLGQGRSGFKSFFRTLFGAAAGLLVMTLVYQRLTKSWILACLAGLVLPGIVTISQTWAVNQARLGLNQAIQDYNSGKAKTSLEKSLAAYNTAVARGDAALQADAEYMMGLAYSQTGEPIRAARHMNGCRPYYKSKKNAQRLQQIEVLLGQLRQKGLDAEALSAAEEEASASSIGLDGPFILNVFLSLGCALFALRLWGIQAATMSVPATIFSGAVLALLVIGGYAIIDLSAGRRGFLLRLLSLLLFVALILAFAAGVLSWLGPRLKIAAAGFPEALRSVVASGLAWIASRPGWFVPAAIGVSALLIFALLAFAAGRSPAGFILILRKGDFPKIMKQVWAQMEAGKWGEAVLGLSQINLAKEKRPERRAEALFATAFAQFKAGHPAEAAQSIQNLLAADPNSKEGLYLAGYMALAGNQADADKYWKRLYDLAASYKPAGARKGEQGARYYYCLALYRKAMALMAKDVEQGSLVLGEVGKIGALDRYVADGLARVHLFNFVQAARRNDWTKASVEAELAQAKLKTAEKAGEDAAATAKAQGFASAAQGLVAFRRGQYGPAAEHFGRALQAVQPLQKKGGFASSGGSLLEQLLRRMLENQSDSRSINPGFARDCQFLAALSELHKIREAGGKPEAKAVEAVQAMLLESLAQTPDFPEGLALLGLLQYHLGPDEDIREGGIEALQRVRERISSKFVAQTLEGHEKEKNVIKDARQAYFEVLQRYLQSADVPRDKREALQAEVLESLKQRGLLKAFLDKGGLEIYSEEELTVQECCDRASLLDAKIKQVLQTKRAGAGSPELQGLIEKLNAKNASLKEAIGSITELEMKILREALGVL